MLSVQGTDVERHLGQVGAVSRERAMALAELLAAALRRWPCVVCGHAGGHSEECPYAA